MSNHWRDEAACRPGGRYPYQLWELRGGRPGGGVNAEALRVCVEECPVLASCRAAAHRFQPEGVIQGGEVWGGRRGKVSTGQRASGETRDVTCRGCGDLFRQGSYARGYYCTDRCRTMSRRERWRVKQQKWRQHVAGSWPRDNVCRVCGKTFQVERLRAGVLTCSVECRKVRKGQIDAARSQRVKAEAPPRVPAPPVEAYCELCDRPYLRPGRYAWAQKYCYREACRAELANRVREKDRLRDAERRWKRKHG